MAHFLRGGAVAAAEAGVRQHRGFRRDAEAAYLFRGKHRRFGDLFGRRIKSDISIADEHRALGQQQRVHRRIMVHSLSCQCRRQRRFRLRTQ